METINWSKDDKLRPTTEMTKADKQIDNMFDMASD